MEARATHVAGARPKSSPTGKSARPSAVTVRLGWSLCALSTALTIASALLAYRSSLEPSDSSIQVGTSAAFAFAVYLYSLVGVVLISRQSASVLGWMFCAIGLLGALTGIGGEYASYALLEGSGATGTVAVAAWLQAWTWSPASLLIMAFLPLLFPTGRPPSARWRPVLWISWVLTVVMTSLSAFSPGPIENHPRLTNPFGIQLLGRVPSAEAASFLIVPEIVIVCASSLVFRYKAADQVTRQQIKWFVTAAVLMALAITANFLAAPFLGIQPIDVALVPIFLSIASLPVAAGIGILRYRLWDIDIIINRLLVYTALSLGVVALYALVVGAAGSFLPFPGTAVPSLLVVGMVAALFAPARDVVQRSVNRLMYGDVEEPYKVLSTLGYRLQSVPLPQDMLPALVSTIREALRLPYAGIRIALADGGGLEVAAESGTPYAEPLSLPLTHRQQLLGELLVEPRRGTGGFRKEDRALLEVLARQAGAVVHAVRLADDLRASRERLVLAREEERRRLRRDLHDDLAPSLAALALTASTAADLTPTAPDTAERLVRDLEAAVRESVAGIRRIVYDLRPPTLDELGLAGAVRQRVAQYGRGIRFTVDAPDEIPLVPAAVEVAAYRIVQEALNNVVKHSGATECLVRIQRGSWLEVEVRDNGTGIPEDRQVGVGLASMQERAAELNGTCIIESAGGTRVLVRLPLGNC